MTETETFQVGDKVYSFYDATKDFVVAKISKSNQLAFGDGPFTSADYVPPWRFTKDRAKAVEKSLEQQRSNLQYDEKRVVEAQAQVEKARATIAALEALQAELAK